MDLTPYVDSLRQELLAAAGADDGDATALAERLTASVVSATRLTMLDVLTEAADEITAHLVPGSVEVRLRGRNPQFVVMSPTRYDQFVDEEPPDLGAAAPDEPAGAVGRINFRPPEQLKAQIEAAAARDELSVNAWLVRATTAALDPRAAAVHPGRRGAGTGRHIVGWVG